MSDSHNGHDHALPPGHDGPLTHYQLREIAVRELLIEKGVFTADNVRREVEKMDQRTPAKGAAVVALERRRGRTGRRLVALAETDRGRGML